MTCIQAVPDQLDEFDADQVAQFLCDPTLTVPQSILLPDAALAATVDFHPHQARTRPAFGLNGPIVLVKPLSGRTCSVSKR